MHDIWQDLANAIIIQAAKDYHRAIRVLKSHPNHKKAVKRTAEIEAFFRSEWYSALSRVDGELFIKRLKSGV